MGVVAASTGCRREGHSEGQVWRKIVSSLTVPDGQFHAAVKLPMTVKPLFFFHKP